MFGSVWRTACRAIATAAFLATSVQIASAEITGEYKPIPCQDSQVFVSTSLTCATAVGRGANDNRAVSGIHANAGHISGVSLHMTLLSTGYDTFIFSYGEQESVAIIKGYHKVTQTQATNWSTIKTDGNTSYMTFTVNKQSCIGFDHAGPLVPGGYEWLLRGFFCLPPGQEASYVALKPYLAETRIGPPIKNLNAFGQTVAALPSSPKATILRGYAAAPNG